MSQDLPLRCRCGTVRGVARAVAPHSGNHVVCYCRDCRAAALHLGRADTLDAGGGSAIFQLSQSQLAISDGLAQVRCLKLTSKGLVRWYAACCNTPIANTLGWPRMPFAGLYSAFIDPAVTPAERARALGPVSLYLYGKSAVGPVAGPSHERLPLPVLLRLLRLLAGWFAAGKHQPSPFFAPGGKATRVEPYVLTPAEHARVKPRSSHAAL